MYSNGLKSHDPCDVTSSRVYSYLENNIKCHIPYISKRYSIYSLEKYNPKLLRLIIPKTKSAMTSAIYAASQFKLYTVTNDDVFLSRGNEELDWLSDNRCRGYSGACWGLPFDWVMGGDVFAPRGTPFPTVTYYGTDAFMRAYDITHDVSFRNTAWSTLQFIKKDLIKTAAKCGEQLFFSYSPIDRFNVVNVNAYCAAMLARVNSAREGFLRTENWDCHLIQRLLRYIVSEQRVDGSWNYWGRFERERPESIDSLHQCYILKMLNECYTHGFESDVLYSSIMRGLSYFDDNFYHDGEIWKFNPMMGNTFELIDHAEAMSMYATILGGHEKTDFAEKIWGYIKDNFVHDDGIYQSVISSQKNIGGRNEINIPFFRWGVVQLLDAMVDLWVCQKKN